MAKGNGKPNGKPKAAAVAVSEAESPGTNGNSLVEEFDAHTASIPDAIGGEQPEAEILSPDSIPELEAGWSVETVGHLCSLPFFLLSRRFGDFWELDGKETEVIARAWKPLLDRWLPSESSELAAAVVVLVAVLTPRVMLTNWEGKPDKAKKPAQAVNTSTAASGASRSTSENAGAAKAADWEPFSAPAVV
jgi:hypothetical protein